MAISLADSLGRTARGDQELAQAQHGLSVAQRKLLSQLGSAGTLEDIARDNGWDADYANKTATRLVELGLIVAATEPRSAAENALPEGESARVLPLARQAPALSKRWPAAAGAITIAAAVLIWWSLSSSTNSTVEQMVQTPKPVAGSTPPGAKPAEPAPPVLAAKPTELPKAVYSMT
ncbi:MAG: MarR family transcriptional regulator, partial [Burkholderiales bacterium]